MDGGLDPNLVKFEEKCISTSFSVKDRVGRTERKTLGTPGDRRTSGNELKLKQLRYLSETIICKKAIVVLDFQCRNGM